MSATLCGNVDDHCPGCGTRLGDIPDDPVMLPRAEHEAYETAARKWMNDNRALSKAPPDCGCENCRLYAALRAAGIDLEDKT